jgi:AraC-like DNA-binding protein
MERLYYFFDLDYEQVVHSPDLPFRLILVSVGYIGLHWHPQVEILFVLKGEVTVRNSRRHVSLGAGDLMLLNSNELHGLVEQSENLILVLQVDPGVLRIGSSASPEREYVLAPDAPISGLVIREIQRDMAKISVEKWSGGVGHEFFCMSALNDLVGTVVRAVPSESRKEPVGRAMRQRDTVAKRVLEYLNRNHACKISLDEVAAYLNVSRYRASHLIRQCTGRSMQENLSLIRTAHAVDLMMTTDDRLIDIAMAVGFSDPKYLNQYFHRIFGVTPHEIRQEPDWRDAILDYFGHDGLDPSYGRALVEAYL